MEMHISYISWVSSLSNLCSRVALWCWIVRHLVNDCPGCTISIFPWKFTSSLSSVSQILSPLISTIRFFILLSTYTNCFDRMKIMATDAAPIVHIAKRTNFSFSNISYFQNNSLQFLVSPNFWEVLWFVYDFHDDFEILLDQHSMQEW